MRKLSLAVILGALLPACGGGGGGTPSGGSPIPTPTPAATRAVLALAASQNFYTVSSQQQVGRLTLTCGTASALWTISESAGVGARLDNADVYLLEADGDIDGRRVTQGSTTIPARGSATVSTERIHCGYEDRDHPVVFNVIFNLTDDRGNAHQLTAQVGLTRR